MTMQEELRATTGELSWYYGASHAAIGVRGQAIDADKVGGVWDEERAHQVHVQKRRPEMRAAVDRRAKVEATLGGLPTAPTQRELRLLFEPFGAARATLFVQNAFTRRGLCLIALAVETRAVRIAFAKRYETVTRPGPDALLRFLEDEAGRGSGSVRRIGDEAERTAVSDLHAYDHVRQQRVEAEKASEAAYYDALNRKIRGLE